MVGWPLWSLIPFPSLCGLAKIGYWETWSFDPLVKVLDDSENLPEVIVIDSKWEVETISSEEEEINGSDSEDANTIVISSDDEVSNDGKGFISEEEADATESESEVDGTEISFGYGTLTFDD